jgi:hypothetical protein
VILAQVPTQSFNAAFWTGLATILPVLLLAASIHRQAITVVFGWIAQRERQRETEAGSSSNLLWGVTLAFMVVVGPLAVFGGLIGTFAAALALYRGADSPWMVECGWAGLCSVLLLNGIGLSSLHVKAVSDALEGSRLKSGAASLRHQAMSSTDSGDLGEDGA